MRGSAPHFSRRQQPPFLRILALVRSLALSFSHRRADTGIPGQISVDFVSDVATGSVYYSTNGEKWAVTATTSIHFPNSGYMHQALMVFPTIVGAPAYYRVASPAANSTVFTITPLPARGAAEVFAVYGDFGAEFPHSLLSAPGAGTAAAAPSTQHRRRR